MTLAPPLIETEYARRIRARLAELSTKVTGADAELIETALNRSFDALTGGEVHRLNVILRRFAAPEAP